MSSILSKKLNSKTTLGIRFLLNSRWSNHDFVQLFSSIELLYRIKLILVCIDVEESLVDEEVTLNVQARGDVLLEARFPVSSFQLDNPEWVYSVTNVFTPTWHLGSKSIQYSSPGFSDLLGLGEILKQIKELTLSLISFFDDRQKKMLEIEKQKIELEALRIKNAKDYLEILDAIGKNTDIYNKAIGLLSVEQSKLYGLIQQGKLTGVEIFDDKA